MCRTNFDHGRPTKSPPSVSSSNRLRRGWRGILRHVTSLEQFRRKTSGLQTLTVGDLTIEAGQAAPPPDEATQAPVAAPDQPAKASAPEEPSPQAPQKLPELDAEALGLLGLWRAIYADLPNALKGRLVPFAPTAREGEILVVASETEGLIEPMSEALKSLDVDHDGVRAVRAECIAPEGLPKLRSMLRHLRAERDPIYREQLALREHETTQAIVDLFGATVDEVGL